MTPKTMYQVVHGTAGATVEVIETSIPVPDPTEVLVATEASIISPGTERAMTQLAQSSLLDKARARPDLVKQVIGKARSEGVRSAVDAVRTRLSDDLLLGYSAAGTIVQTGSLVQGLRVGQRVATAGAGYANHANYQVVPQNLVTPVPDSVSLDHAAFATIGAIAMHGFRLADVAVGSKVLVVGLGLVGQLTCRIAQAAGCDVFAVDLEGTTVAKASEGGATAQIEAGDITTRAVREWSRGRGADAVLITAGAARDSGIIRQVPSRCRDRAIVVAVGDVGLDVDRAAFFERELTLKVARSYGPGRYDPVYERWAVDYPIGYVRWTEGRNLESFLDLLAQDRLSVDDLISQRFPIASAAKAYELLGEGGINPYGLVLEYEPQATALNVAGRTGASPSAVPPVTSLMAVSIGVGICGAGRFVRSTLLPAMRAAGLADIVHISSSSGISATRLAEREGIPESSSGTELLSDPRVDMVAIVTPHDSHAALVVAALKADKHVFVEKPLALSDAELADVCSELERTSKQLHVGFNRRWSPMVVAAQKSLSGSGPLVVNYQVNAGPISPEHWYGDRRQGGRLLGEVCHFIDTANALIDAVPKFVTCTAPNTNDHDSYVLLIAYSDGSAATVSYSADAHPSTPKELCTISGRGRTVVIDNFQRLLVDGKRVQVESGKGHVESLVAFASSLRSGTSDNPNHAILTTHVSIRALESLHAGQTVSI